jgi:hypothetical protein
MIDYLRFTIDYCTAVSAFPVVKPNPVNPVIRSNYVDYFPVVSVCSVANLLKIATAYFTGLAMTTSVEDSK